MPYKHIIYKSCFKDSSLAILTLKLIKFLFRNSCPDYGNWSIIDIFFNFYWFKNFICIVIRLCFNCLVVFDRRIFFWLLALLYDIFYLVFFNINYCILYFLFINAHFKIFSFILVMKNLLSNY